MASTSPPGRGDTTRRRLLRVLGLVLVWLVVAVPVWLLLFTHSQTQMVVAGHDAVV